MKTTQPDVQELKKFLLKANQPHATGTAALTKETDGSRTIVFSEGDWEMNDNFFGGEPYGGRQVISYKGKVVWIMVYYGRVESATLLPPPAVYDFLREALQYGTEESPYRGPQTYIKENFEYQNKVQGTIENFSGKEIILENHKQIYWATYCGGLVDQRWSESL